MLSAWGIDATFRVDEGTHPRLVYKVQYGETDFGVVSMLLLFAGVFACCVGVLVANAVVQTALAVIYLRVSGRGM